MVEVNFCLELLMFSFSKTGQFASFLADEGDSSMSECTVAFPSAINSLLHEKSEQFILSWQIPQRA
jgi:hypothetical protein